MSVENWKAKSIEIIDQLCKHPIAEIFLNPIDPVIDNVPDYFEIIKNPMDLSTAKKNLIEGKYKDINEFKKSVSLIWENAILYNGRPSLIAFMADEMSRLFNKQIKHFEILMREDWLSSYSKSQSIMYKLFRAQPKALEQFNLTPDTEMLVPERRMARSYLNADDTKLFGEVFRLIEDPARIAKLVQILTENETSIDPNEEEIHVNISALGQKTIRSLRFWALELQEQKG